jgi:DNA-binding NarL/FixJ family response regulator
MASKKSTLGSTLTALQKAEAQVEQLRKKAASERAKHLAELHLSFGFTSRRELLDALSELDGTRRSAGSAQATRGGKAAARAKGTRARLTPEAKAEILEAIKAGGSGVAVAQQFSISIQTVQNIKKAAGLVQARTRHRKK